MTWIIAAIGVVAGIVATGVCAAITRRRRLTIVSAAAGLATIPGGGGEIFAPRVRRKIGLGKCSGDDWLRVMRVAHEEGMNTSCTMLIGHIEFVRERIEHMAALRDMQDYAKCGIRNAECGMKKGASSFRIPNSAFATSASFRECKANKKARRDCGGLMSAKKCRQSPTLAR